MNEPRARNTDPSTSHEAAEVIKPHLNRLEKIVFETIFLNEGLTTKEIAFITGLDRVTVSPRIKPLCNKGVICDSGMRRGRSIVWVATPE